MKQKRRALLPLLAAVLAAALLALFGLRAAGDMRDQSAGAVRQAVLRCAAQCYAVEGVYPAALSYLEEHYGLIVNHRRYIITYDAFSSNLPPEVTVLLRGGEGGAA